MQEENGSKKELNQHCHSSAVGCVMTRIIGAKWCGKNVENYYCLTHDKLCTKTGWELGWYLGTNSSELWDSDNIN